MKNIAGLTKEEILATLTPMEIENAAIEHDGIGEPDAPIMQAYRALTPEQQKAVDLQTFAEHKANVDAYRAAHGYDQIDWSSGSGKLMFIGKDGVRRNWPQNPAPGSVNSVEEALRMAGLRK